MSKITTATIRKRKLAGEKIVMITAYDYPTAKLVDTANVDIILIGDSLGSVVLGYPDSTRVTMDDMLHHTKAVSRANTNAMALSDMPFLSYHTGVADAVNNAGRLIREGGATAVKLEGGAEFADEIRAIVRAGIPVCGHLGLTPQSIHKFGGHFIQGKTQEDAQRILDDAKALQEAGAFAIVLECIPAALAERITKSLEIPTVGIGAGACCDGQVLVSHDMLGMYHGRVPSFVKQYTNLGEQYIDGVSKYVKEVKDGTFPEDKHTFNV